jgi:excisionase family DNA binding protein
MIEKSEAVSETAKPASTRHPNPSASARNGRGVPPPIERLAFSLGEVASMLGLSNATVYRMVQRGDIKPIRGIRHHTFSKREIDRLLSA